MRPSDYEKENSRVSVQSYTVIVLICELLKLFCAEQNIQNMIDIIMQIILTMILVLICYFSVKISMTNTDSVMETYCPEVLLL